VRFARSFALACGLVAPLAFALPAHATPEEDAAPTFPIAIAVAVDEHGAPAASDEWIASQIEGATELFGPIGVRFRWMMSKEIPSAHLEMHSRADRDALAALVEKNVIDVFVVAALEDVDERGRMRKGVAWTNKTAGKRYLILSAAAPRGVLTHELGHFFGNAHTDVPDNLMSYSRTGAQVFLDDPQITRTREFSRMFLGSGRLVDVGPPRRMP
jgi:hypothetical protein